ncbi:MAG TPA: hypothetical protein DCQ20_08915 [Nitrospira sp.]|nr:hypothetical protein [Nitrospira sp.]
MFPSLRSAFNYDTNEASDASGLSCPPEEGVTQQSFAEECDINTIVRRFGLTGELPQGYQAPVSGDFTGISDFQTAMQAVRSAEERFMELPASLRSRFNHDPGSLMSFLDDESNRPEAVKLGLLSPPPEVTRDAVKAIDDLAAQMQMSFTPASKP